MNESSLFLTSPIFLSFYPVAYILSLSLPFVSFPSLVCFAVISLVMGFVVAAPSGVAVILAVSKGGFNAIVGTAISASLLPPIVNSGLCLALGIQFSDNDQSRKYLQYAAVCQTFIFCSSYIQYSFLLWFINFVVIVFVGFLTFRLFVSNSLFLISIL